MDRILMKTLSNRNHGLDILRSVAILLVIMSHYTFVTGESIFGPLGKMGGMGVDLFFALSGYLIGHQIFSALKMEKFSLKLFYARRLLRTLPNYFFVLGLYCLFPIFREEPFTIPLWKFLTFMINFGFKPSAFSHAWSLCIEEQFYLILPLIALFLVGKLSWRWGWFIVLSILIGEIMIRACIWLIYLRHAGNNDGLIYMKMIYAPTFTRLDSLVLGVSLALLKIYQSKLWTRITKNGNAIFILGVIGYCCVAYLFQHGSSNQFFSVVLNYSLLALSSTALMLSVLSENSLLANVKIPGAMTLATWSYAIYLTHKPLMHLIHQLLLHWHLADSVLITFTSSIFVLLAGGWMLYTCVEKPFLRLREKIGKVSSDASISVA